MAAIELFVIISSKLINVIKYSYLQKMQLKMIPAISVPFTEGPIVQSEVSLKQENLNHSRDINLHCYKIEMSICLMLCDECCKDYWTDLTEFVHKGLVCNIGRLPLPFHSPQSHSFKVYISIFINMLLHFFKFML